MNDVRRMNVALTRAKKKLVVIGDSATLSFHPFYKDFLDYVESISGYKSAWEFFWLERLERLKELKREKWKNERVKNEKMTNLPISYAPNKPITIHFKGFSKYSKPFNLIS